ncbi:hypothetical protein GCM10017708_08320 [Arthrobacter citreus]
MYGAGYGNPERFVHAKLERFPTLAAEQQMLATLMDTHET